MAQFLQARHVRQAAVAGTFYPSDPFELRTVVREYVTSAPATRPGSAKAIIAPHAGYIYSGPIAGTAYQAIRDIASSIRRVVLLGPSHRVGFSGVALSTKTHFQTPLGEVELDQGTHNRLLTFPFVKEMDQAHAQEHGLEVHLPFLQELLNDFYLVPMVVGDASTEQVAKVLESVWGGSETLIVVSSDLSHYNDYSTAQTLDENTSRAIVELDPESVTTDGACGARAVRGLLEVAKRKGMTCQLLDLRNSGDTAGDRTRVVGYGAYAFEEPELS